MKIELIESRIKELTKALEQSAVNHHALQGRLEELKYILTETNKECPEEENVAE